MVNNLTDLQNRYLVRVISRHPLHPSHKKARIKVATSTNTSSLSSPRTDSAPYRPSSRATLHLLRTLHSSLRTHSEISLPNLASTLMTISESGSALSAERRLTFDVSTKDTSSSGNSGVVKFRDGHDSINGSTERVEDDYNFYVRTLPEHTCGKLLAEGSSLAPSQEIIRLFLESAEGIFDKRCDTIVHDSDGEPYAGGVRIKEEGHRFVVYDKDHTPLALCLHERGHAYNTYNIFGRRPMFPAQDAPSAEEDGSSFYPHFRIRQVNFGRPCPAYRSIMAWNGSHFEPMWRAYPPKKHRRHFATHFYSSTGHLGPTNKMLIQCAFGDTAVGLMRRDINRNGWDVSIFPGVDPCLMICIAAVLKGFVDVPSAVPPRPDCVQIPTESPLSVNLLSNTRSGESKLRRNF
jgi:hypothetical protein